MTTGSHSISIGIVRALFDAAIAFGAAPAELCARYGVAPETLADVDARVPATLAARLWLEIPARCPVPHFGLWLGERLARGSAQTFPGHLLQRSADVLDALRRIVRLERVLHDVEPSRLIETSELVRLSHDGLRAPVPTLPVIAEFGFAYLVVLERLATGVHFPVRRVTFQHVPSGGEAAEAACRALFCGPVEFAAEVHAIELDRAVARLPHRTADPSLLEVLESHARGILAQLPREHGLAPEVRRAVTDALLRGDAGLEVVAARLGLGARTVQRRLADEGTSHSRILDEVRRALAERWLPDRDKGLGEIAFALGFSDQAAFHRAFVRWTGETPGGFRRRARV